MFSVDGILEHESAALAILGHEVDSVRDRVLGRTNGEQARRSSRISPSSMASIPNTARASSVRPAPISPAIPRISPALSERLMACFGWNWVLRPDNLQNVCAGRGFGGDVKRLEVASDHEPYHRVPMDMRPVQFSDDRAVTKDDDAVGASFDLVQPVRDEDDRHAIRLELANDPHEPFRLRGGQSSKSAHP